MLSGFAAGLHKQLTAAMDGDPEVKRVRKSLIRQVTDLKGLLESSETSFKPPKYKESLPPSAKWDDGVMFNREGKPKESFYKVSPISITTILLSNVHFYQSYISP